MKSNVLRTPYVYVLAMCASACAEPTSEGDSYPWQIADSSVHAGPGLGGTAGTGGTMGAVGGGTLGGTGVTPPIVWPDAGATGGRADAGAVGTPGGMIILPGAPDAGPAGNDASLAQPDAARPDSGGLLPGARPKPFCMQKDSQLIVIGDSYISWISHSFPDQLASESGQSWRLEAIGGSSMGSGGIADIPSQFDLSIELDPDAHTVLMDGGGNDVLLADPLLDPLGACTSSGSSQNASCQEIVTIAINAAVQLMDRMASKGIRDVIYFFYPHVPANTILTADDPNEILDYALPMARALCENAEQRTGGKLRCTFIDMVPVFQGRPGLFNSDIHPNDQGSALMANKVWEVMTQKCIGQKGPKECCESK